MSWDLLQSSSLLADGQKCVIQAALVTNAKCSTIQAAVKKINCSSAQTCTSVFLQLLELLSNQTYVAIKKKRKPKQTSVSIVCVYLKELAISQDLQYITSWNSEYKDSSQPGSSQLNRNFGRSRMFRILKHHLNHQSDLGVAEIFTDEQTK